MPAPDSPDNKTPAAIPADLNRIITLLAVGGFAMGFNIRVTDPLLPSFAEEFNSTPGKVAIVAIFYGIAHGLMQFIGGPIGDRYGKLRVIVVCGALAAVTTAVAALAQSLPMLAGIRLLSGASAAVIMPLTLAFIGDSTPYEIRQVTAARIVAGIMLGTMMGQALSGIIADFLGWRAVFLVVGAMFTCMALGLIVVGALRQPVPPRGPSRGVIASVLSPFGLLREPEVRLVVGVSFAEGFLILSAATFLGAYLHDEFGLSYSHVGMVLAAFGAGGLLYTFRASWLIGRLGERGLVTYGGFAFCLFFALVSFMPVWHPMPVLLLVCGFSLLMMHNTLQARATQMAPAARGAALSLFAALFFLGQLVGVALIGAVYDQFGGRPVFATVAVLFIAVVLAFRARLPA